ncbi:hypothetical protein FSST1_008655 [Fusarium sambucinum]
MASAEQENKFYGSGVSSDLVPQSQRRTEIIKGDAKAKPHYVSSHLGQGQEEYHRRTVQAVRDQLTVIRKSLDSKVQDLRFKHGEDLQAVQKPTQDAIDKLVKEVDRLRDTNDAKEKAMKTFFEKITNRIDGFEKKLTDQATWYKSNFTTLASGFRDQIKDTVGLDSSKSGDKRKNKDQDADKDDGKKARA